MKLIGLDQARYPDKINVILCYFAELAEAAWYLYQATGNPIILEVGRSMVESINRTARTSCGFATVRASLSHPLHFYTSTGQE